MDDRLSADLASLRISRDDPPPPPARGRLFRWGIVAAALTGAAIGVRAWAIPYAEGRLFKPAVELTEVSLVSPAQASIDLTSTGYVVPQVAVAVSTKISGRVAKVALREGDKVTAGQVLFELDPSDQKSAIASAQARVAAARARAAAGRARAQVARANLAETKQQWEREKKLALTGAISTSSAEDLGARVTALEETVKAADVEAQAADADANAAHAEVAALKVGLENLSIAAPIDGTATTKPRQVGDPALPGNLLVQLVDFSSLLVETDVPEARLGLVKKGAPCEVVLDAFPDKRLRGEVVSINPILNRAKATGTVKVKLLDGADIVLPEMAARVSFLAKALDAAQLGEAPKKIIPAAAVVERAGAKVAFVFEAGKVRMVPVTVGAPFGDGLEVVAGPAPGTKVIRDPPAQLTDGDAVKESGG